MKFLFKNFSLYLLSSIFSSLIGFIGVVVFTKYILPSEYGLFSILMTFFAIFTIFMHGNTFILLTRKFYKEDFDEKTFVINLCFFIFIMFIFLLILNFLIVTHLFNFFNLQIKTMWIYIILFYSLISSYNQLYFTLLRLKDKSIDYFKINFVLSLLRFGISFLLISFYKNWESLIIGAFFSEFIIFLLFVKKFSFTFSSINLNYLKEIFSFFLKILPTTLSWRIITFSDRIILLKFATLEIVGIYSIALKLVSIIEMFIHSFNKAFNPYFMKNMEVKNKKNIIFIMFIYVISIIIIDIFAYYLMPFFIKFFKKEYCPALDLFNLLLLLTFFRVIHIIVSNFLYFFKKEFLISKIVFIGALINIPLNIILFHLYEVKGVIIATIFSYLLICILELIFLQKQKIKGID